MKPSKNVIERFLKNDCTSAEAEIVDRFFKENPDELEHYFPVNAWLTEPEAKLDATVSDRMLEHVRGKYKKKKQISSTAKILRYVAAASVVGLVIVIGLKIFTSTETLEKQAVAAAHANTTDLMQTIDNKTNKVMQMTLSDCSVVALYPNGILQYLPAFEENRRILYLKGKARFDVSKDKTRPFTVYASGIATTALGTRFIISVLDDQRVSVTLKEGIVKVSPEHGKDTSMHVLLSPGDQLVVNSEKFHSYSLTHEVSSAFAKVKEKRTALKIPHDTTTKKKTRFVFKNQPLKDVFRKVEEKFNVTIDHKNIPNIEEKLFTGIFLENDNLKFICDLICKLHGLNYSIEKHTVIIIANE